MKGLILHPYTAERIHTVMKRPSQALMIVGPVGSGKQSVANWLIAEILDSSDVVAEPYVLHIVSPDGKAIGIESVRELEKFLTLKVPSDKAFNRAVLIENGHLLTVEAQNALLKTLEEPPVGTIIILTVSHAQSLLPTIRSRVQEVPVKQPDRAQLQAYFEERYSKDEVKQSLAISSGLPGLMTAILTDENHPLLAATETARQILRADRYERLLMVEDLAKDKQRAADALFILQQMAHVSLQSASTEAARKWQRILTQSYQAAEALRLNANAKLVLSELMLTV